MEVPRKLPVLMLVASACLGGYIEQRVSGEGVSSSSEESKTKNNIVTVIKERVLKDGTKETDTIITDRSKKTEEQTLTIAAPPKDWMLAATVNDERSYGLSVQRRILGNIFLGAFADTNARFGASLGLQF